MDYLEWVVIRQEPNGDRFFIAKDGYWTPDFFQAQRYLELSSARREAHAGFIVMTAREAYQLTVVFDARDSQGDGLESCA